MKSKQMGYGIVEYLLGAALLTSILFVPVNNGKSLSLMLIGAVKKEHAAYIRVSSMANVSAVLAAAKKNNKKNN
jgi:hypothetical protein